MKTTVRQMLDSKGAMVWSVHPDATVLEAVATMSEHDIGALPVLEDGRLAGIVTERDYARKVILEGRASKDTPVRVIMTADVVCVDPEQTVEACMALMTERRLRHLPVLQSGALVGIVSIGDLVKAIIEQQSQLIDQLQHYISG